MENENTSSPNPAQRAWLWFKGLGRLGKALVIVGLLFVLAMIVPNSNEPEPQPVAQVTVEQEDDSQAKVEEAERNAAEAERKAEEAAEKQAAEEKAAEEKKAADEKAAAEAAAEEDTTDRDVQLMAMEWAWNDASYEDQELMCMGILLDEEAMIDSFLEGADGSAYALTRDDILNFFHSKCTN